MHARVTAKNVGNSFLWDTVYWTGPRGTHKPTDGRTDGHSTVLWRLFAAYSVIIDRVGRARGMAVLVARVWRESSRIVRHDRLFADRRRRWAPSCYLSCCHSRSRRTDSEMSTGPFCVTRSNPTHQLTDPTQPTQPMGQPNPWTTLKRL